MLKVEPLWIETFYSELLCEIFKNLVLNIFFQLKITDNLIQGNINEEIDVHLYIRNNKRITTKIMNQMK